MNIVFFAHPIFLQQQSMQRYASLLQYHMSERGHKTEILSPKALFYHEKLPRPIRKWLGYIDQYLLFPFTVKKKINTYNEDTLFVFTDQALGPWVNLVVKRPHVIHCHDFLAQRSALGEIAENPTSYTGKVYQSWIREGYKKGKNFISISKKTEKDLIQFLGQLGDRKSHLVYNGLNQNFNPTAGVNAKSKFKTQTKLPVENGFLLHVGSNSWYKNRPGVIKIYNAFRRLSTYTIPLILIGKNPNDALAFEYQNSPFKNDIHFITEASDELVKNAYAGASAFLFPSLAEGFGWPIAEAQASGCLVLTTNEAPMNEVAEKGAILVDKYPNDKAAQMNWADKTALALITVLGDEQVKSKLINEGLINVKRFDTQIMMDQIEQIYYSIVSEKQ